MIFYLERRLIAIPPYRGRRSRQYLPAGSPFPDQPGASGPDISFAGCIRPQFFRHIQRFRDKLVDRAFLYDRAQIGKPDIEVGFKDSIDFRDLFVHQCLPGVYRQEAA